MLFDQRTETLSRRDVMCTLSHCQPWRRAVSTSVWVLLLALLTGRRVTAFQPGWPSRQSATRLSASVTSDEKTRIKKERYVPKWKKKQTLAEEMAVDPALPPTAKFDKIGIKGNILVSFKQGDETKTTMALPHQPLRDVATQAGQFIKYGCGKGECGTCECLIGGKWQRPCSTTVQQAMVATDTVISNDPNNPTTLLVQVKDVKAKVVSSGKFYSIRSFLLGFWNNFLGMIGFVRSSKAAKNNWQERMDYEKLVAQKALEKKRQRAAALKAASNDQQRPGFPA
jgi:ferredoxin